MKKIILLLILAAFFIVGCDTVYKPPVTPICLKPEYSQSVICEIGNYLKVQPEQMHDIIIDSTLLGIGTKIVDGPALKKSTDKIRVWIVQKDILTMEGVTKYVMEEADINPAFALLLKRRLLGRRLEEDERRLDRSAVRAGRAAEERQHPHRGKSVSRTEGTRLHRHGETGAGDCTGITGQVLFHTRGRQHA